MRTGIGLLTALLVLVWASLWRRAWLEEARRRDDTRIRPIRFRAGMETFDQKLRDRTLRRRQEDDDAVAAYKRELRSGKTRLHLVG